MLVGPYTLQKLLEVVRAVKELDEARTELDGATIQLSKVWDPPIASFDDHRARYAACESAKARVEAARQKLAELEHDLDIATRQD